MYGVGAGSMNDHRVYSASASAAALTSNGYHLSSRSEGLFEQDALSMDLWTWARLLWTKMDQTQIRGTPRWSNFDGHLSNYMTVRNSDIRRPAGVLK